MIPLTYPRLALRRSFWTMDLCVAIVCAVFMGQILVSFLYPTPPASGAGPDIPSSDSTQALPLPESVPEMKNLKDRGIFTKSFESTEGMPKDEPPPPPPVGKLQESGLSLVLQGIVYCNAEPLLSSAIVFNTRLRKRGVYWVGDEITPEVYVDEIWERRVMLDERGKKTYLDWLPEDDKETTRVAALPPPRPASRHVPAPVPHNIEVSRQKMTERLDELLALQESVSIEPYEANGRAAGLRVSNLGDSEIAREMGVEDGDVVQSINNVRVTDRANALEAMNKALNSSMIRVGILRNGQRRFMTYRMKK